MNTSSQSLASVFIVVALAGGIVTALNGCGGSSSTAIDPPAGGGGDAGGGPGPGSGSGAATPTCLDAAGMATSTCAVTPKANICSLGDANACLTMTLLQVYADDGKSGVCMHIVYRNDCAAEVYADTCINTDATNGWNCWTSSVLPGFTIDLSECKATGEYFQVATKSSGQLNIDEKKCPAPE